MSFFENEGMAEGSAPFLLTGTVTRSYCSSVCLTMQTRRAPLSPGTNQRNFLFPQESFSRPPPWPGNVREMLNTLRRAAVWTPGPLIDADDVREALLPCPRSGSDREPVLSQDVRQGIDLNRIIDQIERHYLEKATQTAGGNKARAVRLFGFGNATPLTNRLKKHGVTH